MDRAVYWEGALSIMNEVADAAWLLRKNSFMGRPDHQVEPGEFLGYWVELSEAALCIFFRSGKTDGGLERLEGPSDPDAGSRRGQPHLEAILKEKKKIPVILDDGTLKDWIRIKAREHEKDRVQAHLEADRILIDHLISLGYPESGAAFRGISPRRTVSIPLKNLLRILREGLSNFLFYHLF